MTLPLAFILIGLWFFLHFLIYSYLILYIFVRLGWAKQDWKQIYPKRWFK